MIKMETQTASALIGVFLVFIGGLISIKVDIAEVKLTTETTLCKVQEDAEAIESVQAEADSIVRVVGVHLAKCEMMHGGVE